jgi:PP-loop superfamily ATP-utilizing enzyme
LAHSLKLKTPVAEERDQPVHRFQRCPDVGVGIQFAAIVEAYNAAGAYAANNPDRCFHCKDELFTRLEEVGRERGYAHIVYGVNTDDLGDYRPGQNAASKHQVRAPLVEAGLSKGRGRF